MKTESDLNLVQQECDLYRRWLELAGTEYLEGFLAYALDLVVEMTGRSRVTETARRLDLARSHVYDLIRAFGLPRRHDSASPPLRSTI